MVNDLAKYIDHTQLKPDTRKEQIVKLVKEAKEYNFASVCVNPHWVSYCHEELKGTDVKVCTVIGFPLGATSTRTKVFETEQAISDGASEIDMVINIGELKSGNTDYVKQEIEKVVQTTGENALVKVIIETSLLSDEEKTKACLLAKDAGADYVKTSTGFSGGGASVEDIQLMRKTVGPNMGVKASGGIRDSVKTQEMIEAGATRIGASSGIAIIKGDKATSDY